MTDPLSTDQQFIIKLREIVETNLSREEFDCKELALAAHMSRSAIHRRLEHLGKRNASHFIREIRLEKAREMLHDDLFTAAEVAYKVGFGSPAYFSKCFHEYYGYPPGEERRRTGKEEPDKHASSTVEPDIRKSEPKPVSSGRKRIMALSAFTVITAAIIFVLASGLIRRSRDMSIVVLPFKNLSSNPDNKYLADGITEDIMNHLYNVSDLRVISRTTSEYFRDSDLTAGEISRKVDARNVLEGSVRREGDKVRITVQLIDGHKEQHIWSESYDVEFTDMLTLQGDIASQVAKQLDAIITDRKTSFVGELPPLMKSTRVHD
jgi:TolB-like protein/AraC-like DNA-binding protein